MLLMMAVFVVVVEKKELVVLRSSPNPRWSQPWPNRWGGPVDCLISLFLYFFIYLCYPIGYERPRAVLC